MSFPSPGPTRTFPTVLDLTRICREYEAAWKPGSRPDPAPFVAGLPPEERHRGLLSLLSIEFVERRRLGEHPLAAEYLGRFPQLADWLRAMLPDVPDPIPPAAGSPSVPALHSPSSGGSSTDPDSEDHEADPGDLAGQTLGEYELVEQIGRGGMGVIYRARQPSLNRWVALKVIRWGQLAGRVDVRRFLVEAEAAAGLDHPNIVPIYDIGRGGSTRYYTMKLVEGGNLADRARDYRGNLPAAAGLISKVTRAVHHAHSRGILHRDLKPSNILIGDRDEPLVSDFGLAKRIGGESDLTLSGTIVGSPHYMAPEQAEGRLRDLSTASDVYSIGAILFELATGRPPFAGETEFETLEAVILRPPPRPSSLNARIDRDLETIILKCLAKEQPNRYHTAESLADDLDRWRVGEPIQARPIPPIRRLVRWSKRQPALATLSMALVLTSLIGLAGIIWQWQQAIASEGFARTAQDEALEARHEAEVRRQESEERRLQAEADRARLSRQLYLADMLLASQDWLNGQVTEMKRMIRKGQPKEGEDDLRGFEWHYLQWLPDSNPATLTEPQAPITCVAQDPRRPWFATAGFDGIVRIWIAESYQIVHRLDAGDKVSAIAYSPDGRWLASGLDDGRIKLWDPETGAPGPAIPKSRRRVTSLAFHPDGGSLAIAELDGPVRIWDIGAGRLRTAFAGRNLTFFAVAFSPDGRDLAAGDGSLRGEDPDRGIVFVWDWEAGPDAPPRLFRGGHAHRITSLSFAPDGSQLATASADRTACIWDFAAGTPIRTLRGHSGEIRVVAYSPDGRLVATAGMDRSVRVWEVETTRTLETWYGHSGTTTGVSWWPDGHRLTSVSLDFSARIWDLRREPGRRRLWSHDRDWATTVAFSPDGLWLASGGDDDLVLFRKLDDDGPPAILRGHADDIRQVTFSPDGKEIASASDDRTVILWRLQDRKPIRTLRHLSEVTSVAYSPDGRRILTGDEVGVVTIWDRATGEHLAPGPSPTGSPIKGVAYHPSGKSWAAITKDGRLLEWSEDGEAPRVAKLDLTKVPVRGDMTPDDPLLRSLAYSPDGSLIAAGLGNGDIYSWQSGSLEVGNQMRGHTESVRHLAFSPLNGRLASSSRDGTITIWDVATGQEALTLHYPDGFAQGLAFRPDGRALATAGSDSDVRLWGPPPREPLARIQHQGAQP